MKKIMNGMKGNSVLGRILLEIKKILLDLVNIRCLKV